MPLTITLLNIKTKAIKVATLWNEEYFNKIRPYLNDVINNLKLLSEWRIQLSMEINFMFSKDTNETCIFKEW